MSGPPLRANTTKPTWKHGGGQGIGQSAGKVSHRRYDKTKILPQRLPDYWFMVLITLYELKV